MAIATAIAAAATIGGAVLSNKANKKATGKAVDATTAATEANNALQRDIYGQNKATLAPYVQSGNNAGSAINALLGIGGSQPQIPASPTGASPYATAGIGDDLNSWRGGVLGNTVGTGNPAWSGEPEYQRFGQSQYNPTDTFINQPLPQAAAATTAPAVSQTPQQQYQNAFQNYQNSTGYQFRLGEGVRALDASASARGVRNSGAAAKSLTAFGQGIGSAEFGNYLNALQNQQGIGLSAAGAQAGVGVNYANAMSANNSNQAAVIGNAALANGTANGQMWGGIANGLGSIFGSSFGR